VTNVHCIHLWRYFYPHSVYISLIIPMVQLSSSGSPTYRPLPPLLQLHLPPIPLQWGPLWVGSQRVTNVHCIHLWRYFYPHSVSISLIIPMVQLSSSGSPTYRPLPPLLRPGARKLKRHYACANCGSSGHRQDGCQEPCARCRGDHKLKECPQEGGKRGRPKKRRCKGSPDP
jgi:hypothetical protein